MSTEATVTVNGYELTEGEAMTVRVALDAFRTNLIQEGLGSDEMGEKIAKGYINCVDNIRVMSRTHQLIQENSGV
jgi:hypothetical protein